MITKIKFFLSLTILLILSIKSYSNENIHIVYKVNNEIITNSDIEKGVSIFNHSKQSIKNFR